MPFTTFKQSVFQDFSSTKPTVVYFFPSITHVQKNITKEIGSLVLIICFLLVAAD